MATTDDFTGRNCPFCGAIDSLDVDADRGEAACVECAKVVRMGLEESVFTRYNEGATYEDVDAHAGGSRFEDDSDEARLLAQASGNAGLSRSAAAAIASGLALKAGAAASFDMNTEAGREAKYRREVVHSKMRNLIDHYTRISRRAAGLTDHHGENPIKTKAIQIARTYVGYRREHGKKVEHQNEVAAACFQIASELHEEPVPLAELRVLDPSLRNVEAVRREVIADTRMEETEARLRATTGLHLMRFYLRQLQVQMINFENPTRCLLAAIEQVTNTRRFPELLQLVEAEKVFAAVLLARTEPSITWQGKPCYDAAKEPPATTAHASFAASAHLNGQRVERVMQAVLKALPEIRTAFADISKKEHEKATTVAAAAAAKEGAGSEGKPLSGVKREREP